MRHLNVRIQLARKERVKKLIVHPAGETTSQK
jgi:hypothetical protein